MQRRTVSSCYSNCNNLSVLFEEGTDNTARLANAVRQALAEAQESLAAAAAPTEMRDFIEQYVGPMVLRPDGTIGRKQPAPDGSEAGVKRSLAGVGFEPTTAGL